jgi:hypothetical protein
VLVETIYEAILTVEGLLSETRTALFIAEVGDQIFLAGAGFLCNLLPIAELLVYSQFLHI